MKAQNVPAQNTATAVMPSATGFLARTANRSRSDWSRRGASPGTARSTASAASPERTAMARNGSRQPSVPSEPRSSSMPSGLPSAVAVVIPPWNTARARARAPGAARRAAAPNPTAR
ncbi:hypothetical protein HFP72_06235 [Nocardiopsis sp. ARC36]